MNTIDKRPKRTVSIQELSCGDNFEFHNYVWIKTRRYSADYKSFICVRLSDGNWSHFNETMQVVPVRATVVME